MSKEEELLLGYSPTELQVGEERKRSLSSVISRLSEEWDLRVDSPEKSSDSRSRGYRRGSLDLPRSTNKSTRSRSCDTTTYSPYKCKKNLLHSADLEPLVENIADETRVDDDIVKDSIEMEAAAYTSKVDESPEKDDTAIKNVDQQTTIEKKIEDLDDLSISEECETKNEKIDEVHDKDTSEATKNDVNLDDSFENMEILEKVADSVPEKEESLPTVKNEVEETPPIQVRETRRTRTSTSTGGSVAKKPLDDEKLNKNEVTEHSSTPNSRETRSRVGNDGETSQRESRSRQAASHKEEGDGVGGRDTRSGRSSSLPSSQEHGDSKGVRETRARSRAVAEENQPPARSTRSNRDVTPDTRKNSEPKKKIDSLPRPKRGSLAEIEPKSVRKPVDVTGGDTSTPERRSSRRGQDDRSNSIADTPENEPRTLRRSGTENTPERRSTRSLDTQEVNKLSKSLDNEPKVTRETRKNTDLMDSVKIEEIDENASLGRRLRSLRTDQTDGDKLNRKPSRSPPSKRIKTEEHKVKEEKGSTSKTDVKKDGVVIALKKKKRRFGEKGHAFQEADVIRRVHQLKSQGMWLEKKLPKIQTEPKTKVHWDYVIEEMTWLSDVVQKELKIKKFNAKKCAAMVQKYFKDKELAKIREEKMREANLRKIAANMAREIKGFWANAQKLFEWRVKQKLERKRKEALDQHLQFIVDKTEKYSTLLAESLAESASGQVSRAASVCSGDTDDTPGDQEYAPDSASSDDEETIDKEEIQAKDDTTAEAGEDEELADLEAGAEVPIEELLKKYYPDQLEKMKEGSQVDTKADDTEIKKDPDVKEEIADTTMTTTETTTTSTTPTTTSAITTGRRQRKPIDFAEVERKIKEENAANDIFSEAAKEETKDEEKIKVENDDSKEKKEDDLLGDGEDKLEEYANMAAKFQPTGNTLETTAVKTKVPSLLKHTLREYQHIGLDWMVSLYERGLNGILADEMGLGKTIQTIALLAHLAVDRNNWGPHLIVVPTSVMLNWEMEIKKWCPGFKVLVYYGSQKERRMKRVGWTKQNAFHICITSYKLVIQDHSSFRRFRWQYFILDEAQHIKNFKSQRWQLLLNFASVGRLLLTGTPLQNNLMELWSLMHFLMPHVFESHRDFKEWFSNPLSSMVEGNNEYNDSLIKRLHKVLRPFILRRLKSEVEKQLPKKYEHLVKCPLSKRQRYLYDDFMSRANTKATLASGNLLSVINVLMQLRKCCNHPNLFEPRPTLSPFVMDMVDLRLPKLVQNCVGYNVHTDVDLSTTSLNLLHHELNVDPYTVYRASCLATPHSRMLNPPGEPTQPTLSCPTNKMRLEVKSQNPALPKHEFEHHSPVLHLPLTALGYVIPTKVFSNKNLWLWKAGNKLKTPSGYFQIAQVPCEDTSVTSQVDDEGDITTWSPPKKIIKLEDKRNPESGIKQENNLDTSSNLEVEPRRKRHENKKSMRGIFSLSLFASEKLTLAAKSPNKHKKRRLEAKAREAELNCEEYNQKRDMYINNRRSRNYKINQKRCDFMPFYGSDLVNCVEQMSLIPSQVTKTRLEQLTCSTYKTKHKDGQGFKEEISCFSDYELIHTLDSSYNRIQPIFERFILNVPNAWVTNKHETVMPNCQVSKDFTGDRLVSRFQIHVPDTRLIQYDCGKLQVLSNLLRKLHLGGHRALIFTQMTRMLDVLEAFLNYHGYVYMRLDGTTKVEMRQALMERFNNNSKYFIFILSTRSGGVGINLTGADTVIFYDSDWNPTMDAQAQDRCHRIGQTRDVHIYRLISERTVEENILKKANQKRLLGDLAIEGGNFTTAFFKKETIHDLFEEQATATNDDLKSEENTEEPKKSIGAFETALATAEDDTDRQATKDAKAEENIDEQDFNEQTEEDQFNAILAELSKVEVFALKYIESNQDDWVQGQLAAAQAEIEARKEEFDAEKLDELTQEIREEMGDISSEGGESEEDNDGDTDEGEYSPEESGSDDEETIEKDEKEVDEKNNDNEINMLENEAEVPIEELIKQYYPDQYKEMDLEIQEVNGTEIDGVAVSVTVTQSSQDLSNQMEVEGLSTDNVVESEEFHIETLEHVTQEVLEQVQEGFVAHEVPHAGENHSDQNYVTTDDTVSIAEPLVNGNEEVHVEVLGDHHNENAEVVKESVVENNAAVIEASVNPTDESVNTAEEEIMPSTSNAELPTEDSKVDEIPNQDAEIKGDHEEEADNKEEPHENSEEKKVDINSEEINTNATEPNEESQTNEEEKEEEETISDTSNISLNLELSES